MMRGGNRQMRRMMGKMGANMREIEGVKEVIIRTAKKEMVVSDPVVQEITGSEGCVFAVTGKDYEEVERDVMEFPDEDIDLVCAQTGADREKATGALSETRGDLAQAILLLKTG